MSNITVNKSDVVELVFVPMPGMGHTLAIVEMAKLILVRDPRISITVYVIDDVHVPKIKDYVKSKSHDNPYPTRLTFIILPTLDPLDPLTPNFFTVLVELHKPLVKRAVLDRVNAGWPKPIGFVVDMFCTTMIDVASELNIPSYIFFTSGANFLNLMFYVQSLADYRGVNVASELSRSDVEFLVPGYKNPVTSKVIPALLQNESSCRVNVSHCRRYMETKGMLVNTFFDLETFPIETLNLMSKDGKEKVPSVYPVGPVLELDEKSRESCTNNQDDTESELIMKWLDEQPESSVVFLCFGSKGYFDPKQVKEIAHGLEASGHRFVWSLRKPPYEGTVRGPPSNDNEIYVEALPEGFLHSTADRGKVIGWASQTMILAHPAIGGFVSHCGWNSILESIWFGVPIATWPIHSEQQFNAFELVKELDLAVEIRIDFKQEWQTRKVDTIVKAGEIKNAVQTLMCLNDEMKEKIRSMKDKSRRAIEHGGSSYNSLGCFIQDLFDNVVSTSY